MFFKKKNSGNGEASPPPVPTPPEQPLAETIEPANQQFEYIPDAEPDTNTPAIDQSRPVSPDKLLQASFGQVVTLLLRIPNFQNSPMSVLTTAIVPGIARGQFLIAEGTDNKTGRSAPLAAVLWAYVSDELDERLSQDQNLVLGMNASEWASGDIVWITVAVGDQRLVRQM